MDARVVVDKLAALQRTQLSTQVLIEQLTDAQDLDLGLEKWLDLIQETQRAHSVSNQNFIFMVPFKNKPPIQNFKIFLSTFHLINLQIS